MFEKIEIDAAFFSPGRERMIYTFNRTEGAAQEHLYPRHANQHGNKQPYTTWREMIVTLDAIYIAPHIQRNARNAYIELTMALTESFQDFKTRFLHIANDRDVPAADYFMDLFNKLTVPLRGQLISQLYTFRGDFNSLCNAISSIDSELRRFRTSQAKQCL
jgi:hypothetical protein